MGKEELLLLFYKKIAEELRMFKETTLKKTNEQIYNMAYIIMAMQYIHDKLVELGDGLSVNDLENVVCHKDLLDLIYYEWMKDSLVEEEDMDVCVRMVIGRLKEDTEWVN